MQELLNMDFTKWLQCACASPARAPLDLYGPARGGAPQREKHSEAWILYEAMCSHIKGHSCIYISSHRSQPSPWHLLG